jgi:hypothetical protein
MWRRAASAGGWLGELRSSTWRARGMGEAAVGEKAEAAEVDGILCGSGTRWDGLAVRSDGSCCSCLPFESVPPRLLGEGPAKAGRRGTTAEFNSFVGLIGSLDTMVRDDAAIVQKVKRSAE